MAKVLSFWNFGWNIGVRITLTSICGLMLAIPALAGGLDEQAGFKVMPAIVRVNLAIFPVAASHSCDTSQPMTLDEGVHWRRVTVREAGEEQVAFSSSFGSMCAQMAQPSVRTSAMAERNQNRVWAQVRISNAKMANNLSSTEAASVGSTSFYAKISASATVAKMVSSYGGAESEQAIPRELRATVTARVVVAINRRVLSADVFASTELLSKYWPKRMRSYVAEAMTSANYGTTVDIHEAELYMNVLTGGREIVETEPEVYRGTDITGDGFRVFELMALLPKTGFNVQITKIRQ